MAYIQTYRSEKGRIKMVLPYDPELIAAITTIPGRRCHPQEKCWTVPVSDGVHDKLFSPFAGEQLEIDLRCAQEVPGHKSSRTTEIYTHVSKRNIAAIRSPLHEITAARRTEGGESDREELANSSSDIPPDGTDSPTKVRG